MRPDLRRQVIRTGRGERPGTIARWTRDARPLFDAGSSWGWSMEIVMEKRTTLQLVNLMPHDFTLLSPSGVVHRGPTLTAANPTVLRVIPSTGVARATQEAPVAAPEVDGIPTTEPVRYGAVEGLPDFDGVHGYIVSLVTVQAARASRRTVADLFTPGDLVRDEKGQPVGCLSLARHN